MWNSDLTDVKNNINFHAQDTTVLKSSVFLYGIHRLLVIKV